MLVVSRLWERRSMAGNSLSWSAPVRLAYLDEAGTSNPQHEPYLVVAGFILNADQDWQPLARHLKAIARRFLPEEDRHKFVFHAKDIWHGSGYFDRSKWPLPLRMQILQAIAAVPKEFHLPVVAGFIPRLEAMAHYRAENSAIPDRAIYNLIHAEAYIQAAADVNFWTRHNARNEVALLVAENNEQTKTAIKLVHNGMLGDDDDHWLPLAGQLKKLDRVVDTVHFAEKRESVLLQIADICAFVIKRHIMGKTDVAAIFEPIRQQIVSERPLNWVGNSPAPRIELAG